MKEKVKTFLKKMMKVLKMPEMEVLPGQLAYFFLLSLVPIITIIVTFISSMSFSMDAIIDFIISAFPEGASDILINFIQNEVNIGNYLFLIVCFFLASNGANSIIVTSNTLYKIKDYNRLKSRIKAVLLTLVLVLLLLFIILVPTFGNTIIDLFKEQNFIKPIYNEIVLIFNLCKWPVSFILIYLALKIIYTVAPDTNIKSSSVTKGSLFTTISWVFLAGIFSIYIANFANYNLIYGSLSSIIILLLWLYILSYTFVIGLALNIIDER